jgi:DNA-binding PadR family transcriptional regulator
MHQKKARRQIGTNRTKNSRRTPSDLIPLRSVEFEILLVLSGGDAHGYAIMKEAEARAEGVSRIETGTLYRALRRLTAEGLVAPTEEKPAEDVDDERRRYFSITPFGREVAAAEARRLATQVSAARARALLDGAQASGGTQ